MPVHGLRGHRAGALRRDAVTAFVPRSLPDALDLLRDHPGLRPVAGCTDLMVGEPEDRNALTDVIDLLRIPEIHGIAREKEGWRIGATTTFAEIGDHAGIRERFPVLAEAAGVVGGWQIQNRATLGGNIANASPAGDSLPVLLALDAVVRLAGPRGERDVPYAAFHTGYRRTALEPGEIVGWILLPEPWERAVQRFRKVGTREAQAISKVVVAMAARLTGGRLEGVRFAAGSVAATPVRLRKAEAACEGGTPGGTLADRAGRAAASEVSPIDDVRSTSDYRRFALEGVVRRMVLSLLDSPSAKG